MPRVPRRRNSLHLNDANGLQRIPLSHNSFLNVEATVTNDNAYRVVPLLRLPLEEYVALEHSNLALRKIGQNARREVQHLTVVAYRESRDGWVFRQLVARLRWGLADRSRDTRRALLQRPGVSQKLGLSYCMMGIPRAISHAGETKAIPIKYAEEGGEA